MGGLGIPRDATRTIPAFLRPQYEAERRRKTVEAVWAVNIIALIMYPPSTLLDWFTMPQHYAALSVVRFAETAALLLNLGLLRWMQRTGRAERWAYVLAWFLAALIAVSLDLFTAIVGGPGTLYYGGLTLLLTAVLVAYPWGIIHTGLLVLAIVLQFNAVLLVADQGWPWNGYFVANYFYVGTAFIGLFWRLTGERLHQREFLERVKAEGGRANMEATLQSIGDAVITTDTAGRVVLMNRVAGDLTGWPADQAQGRFLRSVLQLRDPKTQAPIGDPTSQPLPTGGIDAATHPAILASRNGDERAVEWTAAPIREDDGRILGFVLALRDVTTRQRMEEEIQRAHKLESVGLLAGGIAHDFNNLLTSIWGNVALVRNSTAADHPSNRWLSSAEGAVVRARELTQQLLTFAKGGAPIRRTACIRAVVTEVVGFSLRGSNVRCEFLLPDDLWSADVDESQISQVFSNLIINADEAMPEGGTVRVEARNLLPGDPLPPSLPQGRYVCVTVQDQGVGIAPEHLSRVFFPYFTTKKKGSGLGLAICLSILLKHQGTITVESMVGRGTSFHVFLPASDRTAESGHDAPPRRLAGRGRILVMDDDPAIRELCGQMLAHLGYESATEPDGAKAIRTYAQARLAGCPFDAVILDLTVPGGMGGKEAAFHILKGDPEACLIVSSGYSTDPIMSEHRLHGFIGVIPKPYGPDALGRALHEVLSQGERAEAT